MKKIIRHLKNYSYKIHIFVYLYNEYFNWSC